MLHNLADSSVYKVHHALNCSHELAIMSLHNFHATYVSVIDCHNLLLACHDTSQAID